ncbi:MAG: type III-A CRISPR-associated RAMP protein Csm4 [bacterium]
MSIYLYRLTFHGPVHFGKTGIGLENTEDRLSSDSLSSAIINAFSVLGEADQVVKALCTDKPPFILSSLFPFGPIGEAKELYYALPRPLCEPHITDNRILKNMGKDIKRVRYLQPQDFGRWIEDKPLTEDELRKIIERSQKLAKPCDEGNKNGWWIQDLRPRAALDRMSQNSALWLCGALYFADQAGLYGLVNFHDENWKPRLSTAFRVLGDMGLGGERTYGMGSFCFSEFESPGPEWQSLLCSKENSSKKVLLSLYHPLKKELSDLDQQLEAWDLVERKGYIVSGRDATTLKRQRVWMFTEGSVAKGPLKGLMVDVTPDNAVSLGLVHRVYRSGLAFLLPSGGLV